MNITCPRCGNVTGYGVKFCRKCGFKLAGLTPGTETSQAVNRPQCPTVMARAEDISPEEAEHTAAKHEEIKESTPYRSELNRSVPAQADDFTPPELAETALQQLDTPVAAPILRQPAQSLASVATPDASLQSVPAVAPSVTVARKKRQIPLFVILAVAAIGLSLITGLLIFSRSGSNTIEGVPIYPGAARFADSTEKDRDGSYRYVKFQTQDSSSKVTEFYESQLPRARKHSIKGAETFEIVGQEKAVAVVQDVAKSRTIIVIAIKLNN